MNVFFPVEYLFPEIFKIRKEYNTHDQRECVVKSFGKINFLNLS